MLNFFISTSLAHKAPITNPLHRRDHIIGAL